MSMRTKHNLFIMAWSTAVVFGGNTVVGAPRQDAQPTSTAQTTPPNASATSRALAQGAAAEDASYSLGLTFGGQLHNGGLSGGLSMDALVRGINDGMRGRTVTQEDKQRTAALLRAGKEAISAKNKSASHAFLSKNAGEQGVVTTPSGLQYRVLDAGNASLAPPKPSDEVVVQYRGRLLGGAEFDSSFSRGQPATFRVNSVIKGWQEVLPLMHPGAKWQLFVPPELAYDSSPPATIPPGSLLVFDVELVKINPPKTLDDPALRQSPRVAPPKS